jgi:hypothetical protein
MHVEPASGDVIDVGDSTPRTSGPLNHDVDPDMSDVYGVNRKGSGKVKYSSWFVGRVIHPAMTNGSIRKISCQMS